MHEMCVWLPTRPVLRINHFPTSVLYKFDKTIHSQLSVTVFTLVFLVSVMFAGRKRNQKSGGDLQISGGEEEEADSDAGSLCEGAFLFVWYVQFVLLHVVAFCSSESHFVPYETPNSPVFVFF